jgi:hypothetical protein
MAQLSLPTLLKRRSTPERHKSPYTRTWQTLPPMPFTSASVICLTTTPRNGVSSKACDEIALLLAQLRCSW